MFSHAHPPPPTQVNSLNSKVRALKREKEETEGEVDTLRSRQRQLRAQLEDAEETVSTLQSQVSKLRGASRKKGRVRWGRGRGRRWVGECDAYGEGGRR